VPDYAIESKAGGIVCGIDEAGRGPLAGPVVAAAVILDLGQLGRDVIATIDDSKKLSRAVRQRLYPALLETARIGVGAASAAEIDRINVLAATLRAMQRAVARLGAVPDLALVDGNVAPALPCPVRTIVGGDGRSLSIAAASIVAKVTRDALMERLARRYPDFGWDHNAGYGTVGHTDALARFGATPHHRQSFAPVLNILSPARSPTPTSCGKPL
jgi:ribonuclease HII